MCLPVSYYKPLLSFGTMSEKRRSGIMSDVPVDCVLETIPPYRGENMSQCPDSAAGVSERDKVAEDGNSDSGDSLFITQMPVPEAVRSQRRRRPRSRLHSTSGEETVNEDFIFSTSDDGQSDTDREKKGEGCRLPNLSFSFLSERGLKRTKLPARQNRNLHYSLMGGFFKSVEELWKSYRRGEDLVATQPTIDTHEVNICPISEEEEGPEDKDIRVVEKKHFVVPSKAKRSEPWCSPEETLSVARQQKRRPSESQRRQRKRADKDWTWKPSLTARLPGRRSSTDGDSSDEVCEEGETRDDRLTRSGNVEARPELQSTGGSLKRAKRKIFNQEENEKEPSSNSSATVCEPSPKKTAEKSRSGSAADVGRRNEPESQILLLGDDDDAALGSGPRVKKRRKKKKVREGVEEGRSQSPEEVKGQDPEASVRVGLTEVEEAPLPTADEPDPPKSKPKKKKREKNKSTAEDVDGCADGRAGEDSVINAENGGKKKKKKKRNGDRVDSEGLNLKASAEQIPDDEKKSKKKREKELNDTLDLPQIPAERSEMGDGLENTFVSQLESRHARRKKRKKKEEQPTFYDNQVEGSCTDVDFTNDDRANLSGNTGLPVKKKKENISVACVDVSNTPEEDESAADAQKTTGALEEQDAERVTKKKKKKRSRDLTEDTETPSDYSVSARKKEKKKTSSFLVADEEEKASRTHGGKSSYSEAARGSRAEKPAVSERLAAKAAEMTGSLRESGKKKKKRSATEENVERETEFEEPKETGQVLSETRVRKKKKRKRDESELVSSTERPEGAADEAVVLRKKKKKKKKKSKREILH